MVLTVATSRPTAVALTRCTFGKGIVWPMAITLSMPFERGAGMVKVAPLIVAVAPGA